MSSDMFVFDEPCYQHLGTEMLSPEISSNFFTVPLSALSDSSIDSFLQEISSHEHNNTNTTTTTTTTNTTSFASQISIDEAQSLDQIAHTLFSNSPPSHQLETLSLSQQQQAHLGNLTDSCSLSNGYIDNNPVTEVKTEDFQLGFDSPTYNSSCFLGGGGDGCGGDNNNNGYCDDETLVKFMQRSYSSNSFEGKPGFLFQPRFDTVLEGPNFPGSDSPDTDCGLATGQMRRVCSTGDLPEVSLSQTAQQRVCPSSSFGEGNFMEEANFKVGRYSAEERKERIDRYRAKRTQRNFNKTIKYACRKTLADNRPRIRGRFARNDETGEIPKPTSFHRYEDDDDLWVDNLQEEDEERILGRGVVRGGSFLSNFGGTHFQYCGY